MYFGVFWGWGRDPEYHIGGGASLSGVALCADIVGGFSVSAQSFTGIGGGAGWGNDSALFAELFS